MRFETIDAVLMPCLPHGGVKTPWLSNPAVDAPCDTVQLEPAPLPLPAAHGGKVKWMAAAAACLSATATLCQAQPAVAAVSQTVEPQHYTVMWAPLTTGQERPTVDLLEKELAKGSADVDEVKIPLGLDGELNPLALSPSDFYTGNYLVMPGEKRGEIPRIDPKDAKYFDGLVAGGKMPDVFFIGGHHVISEGWHNDEETRFLFEPELVDTLRDYPNARKVFDNVKFAVLWGCNTMTDLEPHGPNGEYLAPEQIKDAWNHGRREQMTNPSGQTNNLRFYVDRLAREYGPTGPHYEYTTRAEAEKCLGPEKYQHCDVTNLTRILPADGLWDGTHRYNEPATMKKLFPNAYLVLGFSSASPDEPVRARMLNVTLQRSYAELKDLKLTNLIGTMIDPQTPEPVRTRIIETVRKNWTQVSYEMNRHRPSGSITPARPYLDANGIFNTTVAGSKDTPRFAPYERR